LPAERRQRRQHGQSPGRVLHPRERRHHRRALRGSGAGARPAERRSRMSRALTVVLLAVAVLWVAPAGAQDQPANDLLNAVLWMQRSVEYKASALSAFALARLRLDQALADPNWTAAPKEQTGNYRSLPPAVIVDIDETIFDNSGYQAWMAL